MTTTAPRKAAHGPESSSLLAGPWGVKARQDREYGTDSMESEQGIRIGDGRRKDRRAAKCTNGWAYIWRRGTETAMSLIVIWLRSSPQNCGNTDWLLASKRVGKASARAGVGARPELQQRVNWRRRSRNQPRGQALRLWLQSAGRRLTVCADELQAKADVRAHARRHELRSLKQNSETSARICTRSWRCWKQRRRPFPINFRHWRLRFLRQNRRLFRRQPEGVGHAVGASQGAD